MTLVLECCQIKTINTLMINYNYFEILENAYRKDNELRYSIQYRIGSKLLNMYNSIRKGYLLDYLKKEYNGRRIKKYSMTQAPHSDFKYGQYPDEQIRIAVYTCVTNGYDNPLSPLFLIPNVDFILYTDMTDTHVDGWQIRNIPDEILKLGSGTLINRYLKMHPTILRDDYDYAIYIDGNIQVISNVKNIINAVSKKTGLAIHRHSSRNCIYDEFEACKILKKGNIIKLKDQIQKYKNNKFPENFGLYECTVIVSDLKNACGTELLDKWWNEFKVNESLRDQISLPYIIWSNGYIFDDIGNLGYNLKLNPKFRYVYHNHEKRLETI